jgi:hypothetical protein
MDGIVARPGEGEVLTGEDRELRVKVVRPELDLLEYDVGPGYEGPGPFVRFDTFAVDRPHPADT